MRKATNSSLTRKQKLRVAAAAKQDYQLSPDLDLMNGSIETLRSTIDKLIQDIKAGKSVDPGSVNSVYKLSNSLSGLSRARTEIEKVKLEGFQLYNLAAQQILCNMRGLLAEYPQLSEAIEDLIERSQVQAEVSGDIP